MSLRRTTDAVVEPVTLLEAKAHLRILEQDTTDDALISVLVKAARMAAEQEIHRAIMTQTWTKTLDRFPDAIRMDYAPIQSVTSVKYLDENGDEQTLDSGLYYVDTKSEPGWIIPAFDLDWPDTLCAVNAVEAVYVAGWASEDDVPASIKQWILLMVGHYYENREASGDLKLAPLPFISGLLDPFRLSYFV